MEADEVPVCHEHREKDGLGIGLSDRERWALRHVGHSCWRQINGGH